MQRKLKGKVKIPPSKSDSQRAILAAGLAKGVSKIKNPGRGDDVLSMLWNIESLGAIISNLRGDEVEIEGITQFPQSLNLNIGESGLGLRLMTCICAVHDGHQVLQGSESLASRSHLFFEENLSETGVEIKTQKGLLPISILGKMKAGKFSVQGSQSSQYISGLLMALPLLAEDSELIVKDLTSVPYVSMTLSTLSAYGIIIEHDDCQSFRIQGGQAYQATEYDVEGDWSSASYWLVASALGHEVSVSGLNIESKQADGNILQALEKANCFVHINNDSISVDGTGKKAFEFDCRNCPDLVPALVTLAAFCEGESRLEGVSRLRNKESDRARVLQEEFSKIGVDVEISGDILIVRGGGELHTAAVDTNKDHRIAMCLAIAGTLIDGGITIIDASVVSKSYPEFWNDLESLTQ